MGYPNSNIIFGIPKTSTGGKYRSRWPFGDGSAAGAGITVNATAPVGSASGGSSGSGFAARPYFMQADWSRLQGYVSGSVSEWSGSSSNTPGSPLGFASLMSNVYTNGQVTNGPDGDFTGEDSSENRWWGSQGSFLWQLALWANLSGNTAAQGFCADRALDNAAANPSGTLNGDSYQHIEDMMLNTALVVDLCYSSFSAGELTTMASYINAIQTYGDGQDTSFWPNGDVHNNYNMNRVLSKVIAGICGEGWNSSASTHRAAAEAIFDEYLIEYNSPNYTGAQHTEGSYYGTYMRNAFWAMRQYDAVLGTTYTTDIATTAADQLEMMLYQLRPNLLRHFSLGSQANSSGGNMTNVFWGAYRQLMFTNPTSTDAKLMKAILGLSVVYNDGANLEPRNYKAFSNFYWPITATTASALTAKTERRLVMPAAGGAETYLRSIDGWNNAVTCRAMVIFYNNANFGEAADSHANPDGPGFQLANKDNYVVTDPEYAGGSGVLAEAGTSIGVQFSNCVGMASSVYESNAGNMVLDFNEDNTGNAIPHYYVSINAQPYWVDATICRRHYVVLDDLQVVCIWDRVATAGANTKTWRLHLDSTSGGTSVAGNVATSTINGSATIEAKLYDLFATSGGAMSASNLIGTNSVTRNIYRISQTDTADDFISLKVLGVNGRLTAATLSTGTDGTGAYKQADLTINGVSRAVRFYDNGTSHAVVS